MSALKLSYLSAIVVLLALTACMVGPDYQQPAESIPPGWVSDVNVVDADGLQKAWWRNFNDPTLNQLVEQAVVSNPDVKLAEARIAEARANRASAQATLLPTGDVAGSATREANQFVVPGGGASFPGLTDPYNIYQVGFDASWELDLFGRHRRDVEGETALVESSEASRDDTLVSLLAEVARDYVSIRQAQTQLAITTSMIDSDQATLSIARQRFKVGEAPGLDVTQAEAQLESARTQVPMYQNQIALAQFNLDVLIGAAPGTVKAMTDHAAPIPASNSGYVLTAPAKVIADRPDIRGAERKLAAATAEHGAAVAQFFPDISLNGFLGLLNTDAGQLFQTASRSYLAAAKVTWPILSYGTLQANLDYAKAAQQEALLTYQKTILSALSDVEKSVTTYTQQDKFRQGLAKTGAADLHAANIARQRYKEGLTSYLEVLDAERTLYAAQIQLAQANADTSADLIAVYKSLGGGWQPPVAKSP